jgi:hypothetical protein
MRKKTRRSAGAPSACRSTGRACCAPSCAPAEGMRPDTELKLMVPMVTEVSEIAAVRELMQKEVQHLSRFGHGLPRKLQFGAMLEVPALLWQLDELMEAVDFVSVGSNDLFQFSMAVDRGNARVSDRFDPLGKPFLRILRDIVRGRRPQQDAGDAVRRTRRQADFGDGAARHRLPLDLDVAGLDRPGQGDAARARCRGADEGDGRGAGRSPRRHSRCASCLPASPTSHNIPL